MKTTIKTLLILALTLNLQSAILNQQSYIAFAQAPNIEWAKTYGGDFDEEANSIQQTADGGYIIAGRTLSSQSGDVSGQANNSSTFWVVKTDSSGTIEWEKRYGGTNGIEVAYSIRQTTDGGYIVAGQSSSTNGDVGGSNGLSDFWVIKLNTNGDLQWEKNYGGWNNDYAYCVQQTNDGGYIIAGATGSNDGDVTGYNEGRDMWVVKLHPNGDLDWQKALGGIAFEEARSIQQTTDGGYIVAGASYSIGGDVGGNNGNADFWVVKLNSTGDIQWEQNYGGSINEYAYSIQQTTDGGYIVAGYSTSNDGDVSGNYGSRDAWVLKIDPTGIIEWQQNYGGSGSDEARSIRQTTDGGYIFAGRTSSMDGDVSGHIGGWDFWVVKLDNAGNIEWQKTMGGTDQEWAQSIQQTTDGGYIVAGHTESNDVDVSGNNGRYDFWVVKLGATLGVIDNVRPTVSLYPNPVKDILFISSEKRVDTVNFYNLLGQKLLMKNDSDKNERFELSHLNPGVYMLEVTVDGWTGVYKIIKQ